MTRSIARSLRGTRGETAQCRRGSWTSSKTRQSSQN